ncbi:pancreatic triacylglycerol lipase-like [Tachypleus tridentatus]|uniref:pancreatic triacylglycerol lipase-like n=1 Tax=Tachypleus tridentatus TaxID=6853 RepID=UPI003FD51DA2
MLFKTFHVSLVFILLTLLQVEAQDGEKQEENEDDVLKRCYGKIGCFSIGEPFLSLYRPINLFPYPPDYLKVNFLLTTRKNPNYFQKLTTDEISKSDFDPTKPVKILVHDYLEDVNHEWMLQMIRELLTNDDYNIISVDWSRGATSPYTQAVANARMVGSIIAEFLTFLQEKQSVSPSNMHIIGLGVGAHIAGYTGEKVPGLGRITGLDPTGPYFQKTDPKVHLDPSDAEFVDVIHTNDERIVVNGRVIDKLEPIGHVDFYPNGGRKPHGCSNTIGESHSSGHYGDCDVIPSWQLFTESINTDCPFYGYVCDSYHNFTAAKCTEGCGDGSLCASLGFRADSWQQYKKAEPVKMYLSVGKSVPACRYHYHVKAEIAEKKTDKDDDSNKLGPLRGLIFVLLTGSKKQTQPLQATRKPVDFTPEKPVEFLLSSKDLGDIIRMDVEWRPLQVSSYDYTFDNFNKQDGYGGKPPALPVERFEVTNLEKGIREIFCPVGEPVIHPNEVKPLFKGGKCAQP